VRALQQGKDVVVQAPTGSGKTYIFELLYPNLKTQAVFTVPTRVVTTRRGIEPSSSTAWWNAPSRAAPVRVHALYPNLPRSPIMHHKRLMMPLRRRHALQHNEPIMHRKRLTMHQIPLPEF
jgi:hypothetical protein